MELKPNNSEELFLNLAYKRFDELFDEIMDDQFWQKDSSYRFSKVSNLFAVYSELLNYEPISFVIEQAMTRRPPIESKIIGAMFRFVRNIFVHLPVFNSWDDVWVSKELVSWSQSSSHINYFLERYSGHAEVACRFWDRDEKVLTHLFIRLPEKYGDNKIYLKDMMSEKDGVRFSVTKMWQILNSHVEAVGEFG